MITLEHTTALIEDLAVQTDHDGQSTHIYTHFFISGRKSKRGGGIVAPGIKRTLSLLSTCDLSEYKAILLHNNAISIISAIPRQLLVRMHSIHT